MSDIYDCLVAKSVFGKTSARKSGRGGRMYSAECGLVIVVGDWVFVVTPGYCSIAD